MSTLLRRMSDLVEDFVRQESQNKEVVGILVFGSFAKGKVRETSDLDLLVVGKDTEGHSRTRQTRKGIPLEIHRWPLKVFGKPFSGDLGNVLSDAFIFEVMRHGKIVYDPKGILQRFKTHAQTHRLPRSHMKSLLEQACKSLQFARNLLEKKELEGAELETRKAAEEIAKVVLLEKDVTEIVPPKNYVPNLRNIAPDFYGVFREVHNLGFIRRNEVESAVQQISNWREKIAEEARSKGKADWLKWGKPLHGAKTELFNAQDCIESRDLDAAMLQARYSAMLITSPILRLLQGTSPNAPSMRYIELVQNKHPYRNIINSVMNFSHNEQRIKKHIKILENITKKCFAD